MFGHEKFEAYQLSIRFIKIALLLSEEIPGGFSMLRDQLKGAALSVSLNIAEGSGKGGTNDRNRFYFIARGSSMECAAICDVLEILDIRQEELIKEARGLLSSIVSILTAVCSKGRRG